MCELELKSEVLIIQHSYLAFRVRFASALCQERRGRVGVHLLLLLFGMLCAQWFLSFQRRGILQGGNTMQK